MKKTAFLIIFLFGALIRNSFADTLYLRNGTVLEDGTVVEETADSVTFEIYGGRTKFDRSEIDRIEKKPLPVVTESKPLVVAPKVAVQKVQAQVKALPKEFKMPDAFNKALNLLPSNIKDDGKKRVHDYLDRFSDPKNMTAARLTGGSFMMWFVRALIGLFLAAFAINVYFWIFRNECSYGSALLFLIKVNIISNIVLMVAAIKIPSATGTLPGPLEPGGPGALIAAAVISILVFFFFAKRDFDSGIFKTIGLSFVIVLSYLISEIAGVFFGLV